MPGGDRRGPLGEGPMTGRRLGYGAGYHSPGYMHGYGYGRGRGYGGRGFGWQRRRDVDAFGETPYTESTLASIQEQIQTLKDSLEQLAKAVERYQADSEQR